MTIELARPTPELTRTRLLEAAETLFAERGFTATSVRDICKLAGANLAAINYHFGDKQRLYTETVKFAFRCCHEGEPFPDWPDGTPPEQKLRDFIRVMVRRMTTRHRPSAQQLMLREMVQPTEACVELVREYIRPIADRLFAIATEMLPELSPRTRFLIGFSVVGQILHHKQNRAVIELLVGPDEFQYFDENLLAEHITRFSIAAIRHYGRGDVS
jgi:AcrR family transcriptional regulator